jgi:hypothetical protein
MAISINLEELLLNFEIYAVVSDEEKIAPFRKEMEISAFVIRRIST